MNYDEKRYPMVWKRVSRKGYCFTARIPCRVLKVGKRIEIAALRADGKERNHYVQPESLEHSPCHCFSGCKALEKKA